MLYVPSQCRVKKTDMTPAYSVREKNQTMYISKMITNCGKWVEWLSGG